MLVPLDVLGVIAEHVPAEVARTAHAVATRVSPELYMRQYDAWVADTRIPRLVSDLRDLCDAYEFRIERDGFMCRDEDAIIRRVRRAVRAYDDAGVREGGCVRLGDWCRDHADHVPLEHAKWLRHIAAPYARSHDDDRGHDHV